MRIISTAKKRRVARVISAVAGAGGLALIAVPADAAYDYTYLDNGRGYGHVDGRYVSACDTKADNRGVVTEAANHMNEYYSVTDSNGSGGGCGSIWFSHDVSRYRVCSQNSGSSSVAYCTPWKTV